MNSPIPTTIVQYGQRKGFFCGSKKSKKRKCVGLSRQPSYMEGKKARLSRKREGQYEINGAANVQSYLINISSIAQK